MIPRNDSRTNLRKNPETNHRDTTDHDGRKLGDKNAFIDLLNLLINTLIDTHTDILVIDTKMPADPQ